MDSNKEPKPGNFYRPEIGEDPYALGIEKPNQAHAAPTSPEYSEDFINEIQMACEAFGITPRVVYYPCSGYHGDPAKAFPNAKVIFLDTNDFAVKLLRQGGMPNVVQDDALTYRPKEEVDLVILQNSHIDPDFPARTVREGGYVICNNYHHTAGKMLKLPDYELLGLVKSKTDAEPAKIITENAAQFLPEQDDNEMGIDFGQYVFQRKKIVK